MVLESQNYEDIVGGQQQDKSSRTEDFEYIDLLYYFNPRITVNAKSGMTTKQQKKHS